MLFPGRSSWDNPDFCGMLTGSCPSTECLGEMIGREDVVKTILSYISKRIETIWGVWTFNTVPFQTFLGQSIKGVRRISNDVYEGCLSRQSSQPNCFCWGYLPTQPHNTEGDRTRELLTTSSLNRSTLATKNVTHSGISTWYIYQNLESLYGLWMNKLANHLGWFLYFSAFLPWNPWIIFPQNSVDLDLTAGFGSCEVERTGRVWEA